MELFVFVFKKKKNVGSIDLTNSTNQHTLNVQFNRFMLALFPLVLREYLLYSRR